MFFDRIAARLCPQLCLVAAPHILPALRRNLLLTATIILAAAFAKGQAPANSAATCLKCHTKFAGPFRYQHGAILQEGCTACHTPHGSANPKLLIHAKVNTICLECHLPAATVSDARVNAAHTPVSTTPCIECHSSIHGSNHDRYFTAP